MTLLKSSGWLEYLTWILDPVMSIFGLPAEASLALIVGALINIYAGIAVMGTMHLDLWSINMIAVMMLICHNLVVESAVQSKTGVSGIFMTVFRIIAAVSMGLCLRFLLPEGLRLEHWNLGGVQTTIQAQHWQGMLLIWAGDTSVLILKVILIILSVTIFIDVMRFFKVLEPVSFALRPFTFVNGLPQKATFMWMAGLVFGLAYGSGLLIAEARAGHMDRDSLVRLNMSLGINHAIIEDTLLFVAIGASFFWILVPRMLAAALAVWGFILIRLIMGTFYKFPWSGGHIR